MHGFAASKVSHTISLVSLFFCTALLHAFSSCVMIMICGIIRCLGVLVISKSFHPYMANKMRRIKNTIIFIYKYGQRLN
jgi:hypothetical protein